jgi:pilus assembly protein Flp/PilA
MVHSNGASRAPTQDKPGSSGEVIFLLEEVEMKKAMLKLSANLQTLMLREEGQDLIEYALVVALIAFAATAGMSTLATGINGAFTTISTRLTTAV